MVKKSLICFDLDNTLIYSNKAHVKAFEMAFVKNNLKKLKAKKIESMLNGRHAHIVVRLLFPQITNKLLEKVVADHHAFLTETGRYAKQIPEVIKTLKTLKKSYRIAIVSNCTHAEMKALMNGSKITKNLFDYIIGKEDVKHSKPYPDEIFKAEQMAHLDAKFMVGDSIYDIIAAKKAKIKAISVLTGLAKKKELLRYKPDYIIKSIKNLPEVLKNESLS